MISENRQKVKKIIEKLLNSGKQDLSKPVGKFMAEGIMGMLISGTSNLTEIARTLKETISVKHTLKRLQRMASNTNILDIANSLCLNEARHHVTDDTIFALDGGDIVHLYGDEFEDIAMVRDGSTGKYRNGYHLNQITGYCPKTQSSFPIFLDIFSSIRKGFKSANAEAFNAIRQTVSVIGVQGLWVMDRGYDDGKYFGLMCELGTHFITRMTSKRNVWVNGVKANIFDVASRINRRHKFKGYGRFGTQKIILKVPVEGKLTEKEFSLIAFKGRTNQSISYFLTDGYVRSKKEMARRISGYFKRWSVEEGFRFEKQGFGIEKATVRNFNSIQSLLGLTLLSWLTLFMINTQERLKEDVVLKARMEKEQKKDRPFFIYYRLLKGIQCLFEGVSCIFRFRRSKKQKLLDRLEAQQRPVFNLFDPWLEIA